LERTIDSAADRSSQPPPTVIVAAHNEASRIAATIAALTTTFPGAPVWVADNGSSDGTAQIARDAGAIVMETASNIGKGAAMTGAASRALARSAASRTEGTQADELFLLCDGDLGASAAALEVLVREVAQGRADIAVAVFTNSVGGGFGLALGFARWAIERRCGLRTRAPISGQRALHARALSGVLPLADGFGMEIGMTIDAVRAGCEIAEVEVDLAHRATGRDLRGFAHRARQLADFVRVFLDRR
jgi:glycosyltransferase involved in cell wall biosynthesis